MPYKLRTLTVVTVRTPGSPPVVQVVTDIIDFDDELTAMQAAHLLQRTEKDLLTKGIFQLTTKLFVPSATAIQAGQLTAPLAK
jgi:hypothetical protein